MILQVYNIKKYYNNIKAVDDISFSIDKGDVLGLLGSNGAGKSTTLAILSTLIKPDSGNILYNDEDIIKNPRIIRNDLGYVPQELALYPDLTAYDNFKFWGKAYGLKGNNLKERVKDVSRIVGLEERLKEKVTNYSGGMKRRLNIGVTLLHNPKLLIMDEPTVGIDSNSREHILDTIKSLNESGMTIIYTSHYMEEIDKLCNKVCKLEDGKVTSFYKTS